MPLMVRSNCVVGLGRDSPSPGSATPGRESLFGLIRQTPLLLVIYGLQFITNVLLYAIVVFLPYRLEEFGITNTFQIGLFLSTPTLSGGIASFMYGKTRARLSYKAIVLAAVSPPERRSDSRSP